MTKTRLIFVGGFLGAGKTTLLWRAAELLAKRGKRVGLITNDQAPDLVDTKWLAQKGLTVREVAGSCFCCNFGGLIDAAESLRSVDADVLIGEPVGSCTDLSATILQPLKERFRGTFELSPLSVLADPQRLSEVLSNREDALHTSAAYIFRKQLEEADLLVVNKIDRLSPQEQGRLEQLLAEQLPQATVRFLSARTGEGLESWLDEVLSARRAGSRIVDVDYETYAQGEAVLGWLNADIQLSAVALGGRDVAPGAGDAACNRGRGPKDEERALGVPRLRGSEPPEGGTLNASLDPPAPPLHGVEWGTLCSDLLNALHATFREKRARIGHVKLLLTAGSGHYAGNLTGLNCEPVLQGRIDGSPAQANLILNARVEMPPEDLERIVRDILAKITDRRARMDVLDLRCLRPGRPQPTHRYDRVVG